MTKGDFARELAQRHELTIKKAGEVIDDVFQTLRTGLLEDGKFFAKGFGSFTVKQKSARKGRNPKTGEEIQIPERMTVNFKVADTFKATLNEKYLQN
jgi:DNA-binding protein HU-beta